MTPESGSLHEASNTNCHFFININRLQHLDQSLFFTPIFTEKYLCQREREGESYSVFIQAADVREKPCAPHPGLLMLWSAADGHCQRVSLQLLVQEQLTPPCQLLQGSTGWRAQCEQCDCVGMRPKDTTSSNQGLTISNSVYGPSVPTAQVHEPSVTRFMKRQWPSLMLVCLCRHRWWNFVSFTCWFLSSPFSSCSVPSCFAAAVVIFRLWLLTCALQPNHCVLQGFYCEGGFYNPLCL